MVANLIGAGISLIGGALLNRQSAKNNSAVMAQSLSDSKALAKYQSKLDKKAFNYQSDRNLKDYQQLLKGQTSASLDLMRQENLYNQQLMAQSAKATQALNQNLMDYQYALERQSRQTSYGDTRIDLENAGYNPLLAVGQQSNITPVSSGVSTDSSQVENANVGATKLGMLSSIADTINQTSATRSQVKRNNVMNTLDQQNSIANIQKVGAEIGQIFSATRGQEIQNDIQNITGLDKAKAEIDSIVAGTNLSRKQAEKVVSDINTNNILVGVYNAQRRAQEAQTGMYNAQTQNINSSTKAQNINNALESQWQGIAKRHPYFYGLYRSGVLGSIGNTANTLVNAGSRLYKGGR